MDILEIPFVGSFELRKNLPTLLARLKKKDDGVVVTQKGKPAGVLLSVKKYLEMKAVNEELEDALRDIKDTNYILSLSEAVNEVKEGKGKPAKKLFEELEL